MSEVKEKKSNKTRSASSENTKKDFIFAVGRRREAIARIRLYQSIKPDFKVMGQDVKKGDIFVNNKKADEYFSGKISMVSYLEPFRITNTLDKYLITAVVAGGGPNGQLEALIHGISRALSKIDNKNRQVLKKKGFLTRDARARERRKVGMGGKSRRRKQSPKR